MNSEILRHLLQVIVALGLFNVWLLRAGRPTTYRGGGAHNLAGEFAAYGLSPAIMYAVGTLKIACGIALLAGLFLPALVNPAAALLIVLMVGAIAMHLKINDPLLRALPAAMMLLLSALIFFL